MPEANRPTSMYPLEWIRYARGDLAMAEHPATPEVLLELLCFHAQQAAEKAFKAVLLKVHDDLPPRTHDIILLMDLCEEAEASLSLPIDHEAAQFLSQFAVLSRYPADLGEVDENEWQRAVGYAREVVAWAEKSVAP